MKTCRECRQPKPADAYRGARSACRECENARLRDEAASALRADAEKAVAWARPVYARPVNAPGTGEWDELVDIEFHTRPEKPEGEGWYPLVVALAALRERLGDEKG